MGEVAQSPRLTLNLPFLTHGVQSFLAIVTKPADREETQEGLWRKLFFPSVNIYHIDWTFSQMLMGTYICVYEDSMQEIL